MGDVIPLIGTSNGAAKTKKKNIEALDGSRLMIYYATTNQKQASTTEGGMKEKRDKQAGGAGVAHAIVLGALLVDRQLKI